MQCSALPCTKEFASADMYKRSIALALKDTFNIRGLNLDRYVLKEDDIEYSAVSKVTQDYEELCSWFRAADLSVPIPEFLPQNRWASVTTERIKIPWTAVQVGDTLIVNGSWHEGLFYPSLPRGSMDVQLALRLEGVPAENSVTLPPGRFTFIRDVTEKAPGLKVCGERLQCVGSFLIYQLQATPGGLYVNVIEGRANGEGRESRTRAGEGPRLLGFSLSIGGKRVIYGGRI